MDLAKAFDNVNVRQLLNVLTTRAETLQEKTAVAFFADLYTDRLGLIGDSKLKIERGVQ